MPTKKDEVAVSDSSLVEISKSSELKDLYNANASVGSENISQSQLPILKVHATGKSKKNVLADGNKPDDGWFFYKPDQSQFESIECHLLYCSEGFRAPDMNGVPKFQQIIAGVIVNNDELKSFISYVTGVKLSPLWDFGKELAVYTKAKPVAVPMFALRIKMTTFTVPTEKWGDQWAIKFEIMKNADGSPILVTDPGKFVYLRDHVEGIKETINHLISSKATEDTEVPPLPTEEVEDIIIPDEVLSGPDKMPF